VLIRRQMIGERIREARLQANLTQEKLSDLVGVDLKTIHRIEQATSDPSLGLLLQIADAVNIRLADLLRM
jgi:transcriptional regulator with XRE-family HTH domain